MQEVGTPAQTIKVDIDTGSSDLGIQLDTCVQLSSKLACDPSDFIIHGKGVGSCTGGGYTPSLSSTFQRIMYSHRRITCDYFTPDGTCYGLNCYGDLSIRCPNQF